MILFVYEYPTLTVRLSHEIGNDLQFLAYTINLKLGCAWFSSRIYSTTLINGVAN